MHNLPQQLVVGNRELAGVVALLGSSDATDPRRFTARVSGAVHNYHPFLSIL